MLQPVFPSVTHPPPRQLRLGVFAFLVLLLPVTAWLGGLPAFLGLLAGELLLGLILALREVCRIRGITHVHELAMEGAHDGMWSWDPLSKRLLVGARLLGILGYTRNFLDSTNAWLELVHPDDRAGYNEAVARHLKGETPHFFHEYRVRASNGSYRWLAARGLARTGRDGKADLMAGSISDITDRKADEARIRHLAHHDILTGLPNRARLMEQLPRLIAHERRQPLAVLFVDLDRFKGINDTLGHSVGDHLISAVARRISDTLRPQGEVYRQGGDEFIVILQHLEKAEDAGQVADQILERIGEPIHLDQHDFNISASIGIALHPADGQDSETLLRHADAAMYAGKASGGGCHHFFSARLNERLQHRVLLESALRQAIGRQELSLHYQPQVDLVSGRVIGAEALLRWQHAGRAIPPDHFIPVAEETGLIHPIGDWVIEQAIAQAARWRASHPEAPRIAINLSARQFWQPGLADALLQRLALHALPPGCIELEITESVMVQPEGPAINELSILRKQGVHLALDDFGTGYSSLSYLRNLPINRLKIDKSFIQPLTREKNSTHDQNGIVRAIIAMAHSLTLEVVAEGVESTLHRDILAEMGCNLFQGYLTSPALPPEEFASRFLTENPERH
ncbi:GGDEF domain-containing phosphodiesterase [Zoogloea sp.]|uniref:putative bifunctional diguanylate cyclase/phosphodiesterase n=1 Tax=Zoogloea sp. TaxID=49181 RepID=UPI00260AD438|nr:GGDEF domain-containing phosphodiesterase [Zoogloea sp.]MDD3354259.1 EAL domain-containing protein [Zoogloea sp.]